jgi:diguanylate cyclase (GGDEF)-like protein
LKASVRETDTVARLAGDEFVVILENLHTPAEPQFIARKVLAAINRPFEVAGTKLDVTTSIGIAYQSDGRAQPAELVAAADKALYEAKEDGRNTFRVTAA